MISLIFLLIGMLVGGIIGWQYSKNVHLVAMNRLLHTNRMDRVRNNVDSYQIEDSNVRIQNMESHLEEEHTDRDEGVKHRAIEKKDMHDSREERKVDQAERKADRLERAADREERREGSNN